MSCLAPLILNAALALLLIAGCWGLLALGLALIASRARLTVRVRGWLVFLVGVCQLAAYTSPGSPWARWVFRYLTLVFLGGMIATVLRGLELREPRAAIAAGLICPLMLWQRLVNVESLAVFTLMVWSWANSDLDLGLVYAYLGLTATAWGLRWLLGRLSVPGGS